MATASWTVPAQPREVSRLRAALVAFAAEQGVADPPINDLKLAVSEAMTNAVVHAYAEDDPGEVDVTITVDRAENRVCISVADNGTGMAPRPDSPGIGLGLPLIGNLVAGMDVGPRPGGRGTEIRMKFELPVRG